MQTPFFFRVAVRRALLVCLLGLASLPAISQALAPPLVGKYYPATSQAAPYGVLVLGGAEGGIPTALAGLFAAEGYPVLALAYFKEKTLPAELEQIPLEYVEAAISWLAQQAAPGKPPGVILVGWSKGAELALLLASRDPRVKGVIAISPSSVVWAGILADWHKTPGSSWSWQGQPLPAVPFAAGSEVTSLPALYTTSLTRQSALADAAAIPLENSSAQVLLLSGSQDKVWPAALMAEQLMSRLREHGYAHTYTHLSYPELGHLLDEKFLSSTGPHASQAAMLAFLRSIK